MYNIISKLDVKRKFYRIKISFKISFRADDDGNNIILKYQKYGTDRKLKYGHDMIYYNLIILISLWATLFYSDSVDSDVPNGVNSDIVIV